MQNQEIQKNSPKFSIKESVKYGWQITMANFWFFVGIISVSLIISYAPAILDKLVKADDPVLNFMNIVVQLIFWYLGMVITLGLIKISLKFYDKEKVDFFDLFLSYPLFLKYLWSSIVYRLIVLGGLILLVIPGIIWAIKFQFYPYFIVEGKGPIEAIKLSGQITQGAKWHLFLLGLVLALICLAGLLALIIGTFVTMPLALMAMAFVYRKLQSQVKDLESNKVS